MGFHEQAYRISNDERLTDTTFDSMEKKALEFVRASEKRVRQRLGVADGAVTIAEKYQVIVGVQQELNAFIGSRKPESGDVADAIRETVGLNKRAELERFANETLEEYKREIDASVRKEVASWTNEQLVDYVANGMPRDIAISVRGPLDRNVSNERNTLLFTEADQRLGSRRSAVRRRLEETLPIVPEQEDNEDLIERILGEGESFFTHVRRAVEDAQSSTRILDEADALRAELNAALGNE